MMVMNIARNANRKPLDSQSERRSVFSSYAVPSIAFGQSRSVSLIYSSVTADPTPGELNTTLSVRAAVPNTFSTRLLIGGVQQGGEIFTDARSLPEDADSFSRLAHMFNASNLSTGRYSYQATVFSNYLNSSIGGITNGNVIVVNRKNSAFGTGWGVSDLQQLHLQSAGGILLTTGNGRARFFSGGPDTFTSPPRDFSTLVKNADGTFTRTLKDGTKISFSAQGFQTSLVDRNNTTSYAYDADNRLASITDPAGLVTTLTYATGKLQRVTDPAGRQTQFQHDSAGNLIRITNPDGTFMRYAYNGSGRLTQATDERGGVTTYSYDYAGRFSQSVRPGGETRSLISRRPRT
jgi:YD repeat-containing protein